MGIRVQESLAVETLFGSMKEPSLQSVTAPIKTLYEERM